MNERQTEMQLQRCPYCSTPLDVTNTLVTPITYAEIRTIESCNTDACRAFAKMDAQR